MNASKPLSRRDIIRVIRRLVEISIKQNEPLEEPIVMVGGTAMIVHDLRKQSYDIDLFIKEFSIDVVNQIEAEFKAEYGDLFRIDVTSLENIWGFIMLRDIDNALHDEDIHIENRIFKLLKLSIEDLFLLKLDSPREKDRADLDLLMERTTPDRLVQRFNVIWKWHGDPDAVLGFADSLISFLHKNGYNHKDFIMKLKLPASMTQSLSEAWKDIPDET